MIDRYAIVSRDPQRCYGSYVVIDTHRDNAHVFQTNDFGRAIQTRDEMNAESRSNA